MLTKSLLFFVLLAVSLQLNTAEEKFDSINDLLRHTALEFTKATFSSIEKGIDLTKDVVKDLKAIEPKTDADKEALEKLEKYLEKAEKFRDTETNDKNLDEKLIVLLQSIYLVGNFKTKHNESVLGSPAVQDLLKKYNFESVRQEFLNVFKTYAEHFTKDVEDYLTYTEESKQGFLKDYIREFKAENDIKEKLHTFIKLFVADH